MPIWKVRSWRDFLNRGTSELGLWMDADGKVVTTPDNLWPNGAMTEFGEDGQPTGHDLTTAFDEIIGHHYLLSRPGARNRNESLARQNSATIPLSEGAIVHQGAWVPGSQPDWTSKVVPPTPELETARNDSRGFQGGRYGLAYGWSGVFGPAGVGAYVFFDLLPGEYPLVPRPESIPAGAATFDIAMTRRNGTTDTARYVRKIPVERLTDDQIKVYGPWRNRGKPPDQNRSGIPRARKPRNKDTGTMASDFSTLAGRWTPAVQYWLPSLPGTGTEGARVNLVGLLGKAIKVKGDKYRVKVSGPAPNGNGSSDAAGVMGPDDTSEPRIDSADLEGGGQGPGTPQTVEGDYVRPDPKEIRPSGKHPDQQYLGEELDYYESLMVGELNALRAGSNLEPLVLVASLNRAAENTTTAADEGYTGTSSVYHVGGGDPQGDPGQVARYLAANSPALEARIDAIGVARSRDVVGTWRWRVVLGDDPELPEPGEATCERVLVDHVQHDGTVYQAEIPVGDDLGDAEATADVALGWDLVQGDQLGYSYGGSFQGSVSDAAGGINGLGPINCHSGGNQVAISDGALPAGILGRTSSDGRMVFNSALMRQCSSNARDACANHEMWHALGFDHTSNPSVLRTPIVINSSSNYASPTSYDQGQYHQKYGSAGGGGGGGSHGSGGSHPDGWSNQNNIHNPQQDIQGDFSQMPRWIQDMMPGNFGGGEQRPQGSGGGGGGAGGGEGEEPKEPEWHYEWKDSQYAAKTALYFRLPRMVRGEREKLAGLRATYWWLHESEAGALTWYRAYDSRRGPISYFDDTDAFDGRIECPGLPAEDAFALAVMAGGTQDPLAGDTEETGSTPIRVDKRGRGPRVRLIAEEPPLEDTSMLEPPDATSAPEPPDIGGAEELPAGRYSASVMGVLRGGGLTKQSRPARAADGRGSINISSTQTVKVVPSTTVNMLRNAEGSYINRQGEVEDWTVDAATPDVYVRVEDGVWKIGTTGTTGNIPRFYSRRMAINDDMTLTVGSTIGLTRWSAGQLRVTLRQLDENFAVLGNLVQYDLAAVGEVAIVKSWPFATRDPLARYVQMYVVGVANASGSVGLDGYVQDLRVLPFDADIGKYEEGEAGEPANFSPNADTPVAGGSYLAVGPPPEPPGGASEVRPPLRLATFEQIVGQPAGTYDMGGFAIAGNAPTRQVDPAAALFGSYGVRMRDNMPTVGGAGYLDATVAEVANSNVALRALYRWETRPLVGPVYFHQMYNPVTGTVTCYLILTPTGALSLYINPVGSTPYTVPLDMRIFDGNRMDLEVQVSPRASDLITVNAATGNNPRTTVLQRNVNLENRSAHGLRPGVVAGGSVPNKWSLHIDQVVVTREGDVLDRERPAPPQGFPTIVEDRPLRPTGTALRRFDAREDRINQLTTFVNLGEGAQRINVLDDPINVRPGVSYCCAAFMRWTCFSADFPRLRVWLESDDPELDPISVQVVDMGGTRGWHPTARPREDDYAAFTVPAGYTRARPELHLHPGFYVGQEFLFAQESATFTRADMDNFTKRDAMRRYGRALQGSGSWVLPTVPDHVGGFVPGPEPGWWLSGVGVKEVPAEPDVVTGAIPGSLTTSFETSGMGIDWVGYAEPGAQAMRLMRLNVELQSDGIDGPEIPAGGMYTRSWTPVPTLTREDGSPFPGGAYVGGGLWVSSYPQMDPRRVGDRLAPVPLSDVVDRVAGGFSVAVTTEDAIEEIEYLSQVGRLRLEIPLMGNRVAGGGLLVRCEGGISFEPVGLMRITEDYGVDRHQILATGSTEYAEVLQSGNLPRPMGPGIMLRDTAMASGGAPIVVP